MGSTVSVTSKPVVGKGAKLLLIGALLVIEDEEQGVRIELFEDSRVIEYWRRRRNIVGGSGIRVLWGVLLGPR